MLALYKQYIKPEDIKLVSEYIKVCNSVGTEPIIFADKILIAPDSFKNVAVFHTLYITKIYDQHTAYIVNDPKDKDILTTLALPADHNIFIIKDDMTTTQIIAHIKGCLHG
jgi:hypothetical protein